MGKIRGVLEEGVEKKSMNCSVVSGLACCISLLLMPLVTLQVFSSCSCFKSKSSSRNLHKAALLSAAPSPAMTEAVLYIW